MNLNTLIVRHGILHKLALVTNEIVLKTGRLYLRPLMAEDAPQLFELDSDPEVMRFISKGQPNPLLKIQNEILPRVLTFYRSWPPQGFWAAHTRQDEQFIGWFHLRPDFLTPDEMELGYRLKRSAWGKGLATEASLAIVKKSFEQWGYYKISARTLVVNLASQRVMQKAGLKFEAEFFWSERVLPGWAQEERRAVKYGLANALA